MIEVEYEAKRAAEWLGGLPATLQNRILAAVLQSQLLLERDTKEHAAVATGMFRSSIAAQPIEVVDQTVIGVVGSSLAYAAPLEDGTRPHFPPIKPLIPWVTLRFGLRGAEAERVAFLVSRKIGREGTKAKATFADALDRNRDQVVAILKAALDGLPGGAA